MPKSRQNDLTLEQAMAAGAARYDGIGVDQLKLKRQLGLQLDASTPPDRFAEVYLASACAVGDRHAQQILEREYLPAVGQSLRRKGDHDAADTTLQKLRVLLLVGANGEPKIASYRGTGPLAGWLRVVANRLLLREHRRPSSTRSDDDLLEELPLGGMSPELNVLKSQHAPLFKAAFRSAFSSLTPRERAVLRLHLVSGLSLERIGEHYRTHKSTISRWLAHARASVLDQVRRELARQLNLSSRELESLIADVGSQMSISLTQVLKDDE